MQDTEMDKEFSGYRQKYMRLTISFQKGSYDYLKLLNKQRAYN